MAFLNFFFSLLLLLLCQTFYLIEIKQQYINKNKKYKFENEMKRNEIYKTGIECKNFKFIYLLINYKTGKF